MGSLSVKNASEKFSRLGTFKGKLLGCSRVEGIANLANVSEKSRVLHSYIVYTGRAMTVIYRSRDSPAWGCGYSTYLVPPLVLIS
jgi:hypothetical protein